MKFFLNVTMVLLLIVGLFTSFGCGVEKVELDELVDQQESYAATSRAENVTIMGTITDPEKVDSTNLIPDPNNPDSLIFSPLPLAGVVVRIGSDSAVTDGNGFYSIVLEESTAGAVVEVELEGYVDLVFPVSFANYDDNSTENWSISLPETQDTTSFIPGIPSVDTFFYEGVPYIVEIPADAAQEPIDVAIGPSGTVVGPGISGAFAVTGIHIETPEENFEFDNEIAVSYNPLDAAMSGGIGSVNPAATEPGAPSEATQAAEEVQAALDAAQEVIDAGGDPADAATAFVEEIYDGADEVSLDDDGNVVVVNTVEGNVLPGTGVVTEDNTIEQIDENGEPVEEESEDLIDEDGEVVDVPHQGTGDGGG